MTYHSTVSDPEIDPARAVAALRGQLGQAAARDGAALDWSSLRITGPLEVVDRHGRVSYEWAATVDNGNEAARRL